MQVHPVNSAISFGKKNEKKQSLMLPATVVGGVGGAFYANQSKIKLDKDSYEKTVKIIDEKLDKSPDLEVRFSTLKKLIEKQKEKDIAHLKKLGITDTSSEILVDDLLKKYVNNPEKTLIGLGHDITWAKGEAKDLEGEKLAKKMAEIDEKLFIKNLAEKAVDGKVKVDDFLIERVKENKIIKDEINEFWYIVNKFNKKRLWLFSAMGLVLGGVIGSMIKISKKEK